MSSYDYFVNHPCTDVNRSTCAILSDRINTSYKTIPIKSMVSVEFINVPKFDDLDQPTKETDYFCLSLRLINGNDEYFYFRDSAVASKFRKEITDLVCNN